MMAVAPALLYALFVWWFATGIVLLIVLRDKRTVRLSLVGAAFLFPGALYLLAISAPMTSVGGAYLAFTAAILVWATQEIAFLTGYVTGPRPRPCPAGAQGAARLRYALGAILYHEIALIVSGAAVLAVTWHAANLTGALTFLVLWIMRVSAKLNLFLGVPVLNDEVLPSQIVFLRSYFCRAPVNSFFPVAVVLSVLALSALVTAAVHPEASTAQEVGFILVAALMGLAIVEHVFMLVPLPIDRLWRWSEAGGMAAKPPLPSRTPQEKSGEGTTIERGIVTTP